MHHVLWIYLLDRPDVGGIGGSKKLVSGSLAPSIEAPLMISHKVLGGENGMLFDQYDGLREIQARRFESWWIVRAVGITAPQVERPALFQDTSDVAEPGAQQTLELFLRDKIIFQ